MFAKEFLSKWIGEMLYCVDPYEPYDEMPWDRTADMQAAIAWLQPELSRVRFVRAKSLDVASYFGKVSGWPASADLVYIDGAHNYEAVKADLNAWWPIVAAGGIFAGDDFGKQLPGVAQAVTEFADAHGLRVQLTTDYDRDASWFIEK